MDNSIAEGEATERPPKRPRHDADTSLHFKLTNDKQSIHIPTPFPFPQNFPPVVECALHAKSVPPEVMKRFLSVMARATFAIKCYPTSGEYESIGVQVIQHYPFMKSPAGCPYVSSYFTGTTLNMAKLTTSSTSFSLYVYPGPYCQWDQIQDEGFPSDSKTHDAASTQTWKGEHPSK